MLRKARLAKGLQQHDIARQVGVSQPKVSEWERGVKTPESHHVRKLIELLEIPVGDYFDMLTQVADPVERAIAKSELSRSEQDVLLTLYSHFAGRPSLDNVQMLRLPSEDASRGTGTD
ncbi:helix-turn-helix domain-containing protein [Microbispora bryophytorum]|uniref:helix-turn-helix domain-containing protein n=1 Tax=Microbispora bryophytorum TaxID=1460882 RepID=UPI00371711ED